MSRSLLWKVKLSTMLLITDGVFKLSSVKLSCRIDDRELVGQVSKLRLPVTSNADGDSESKPSIIIVIC